MRAAALAATPTLLLALALLGVAATLLLLLSRLLGDTVARRRALRQAAVRDLLFAALMGDPPEAAEARTRLARRHGREWVVAEHQAFGMLPKIKGHSRVALVQVLLDKGAARRAVDKTTAWSLVRRCRGAYELGTLGERDAVPVLLPMLDDRSFLVRRVAVRALGSIADPGAVTALLQVAGEEPRLTNDLVYSLDRIGPSAAPALRGELDRGITQRGGGGRHADLAAIGLGIIGDVEGVGLLTTAVRDGRPSLRAVSARALGRIGAPEAVSPLVSALESDHGPVRVAAAEALGEIGAQDAAEALGQALDRGDHDLGRRAAQALLSLDDAGMDVLRSSRSAYAREALATAALHAGA